eukprot:14916335-Alexandrium_andersonii.AAC.1
MAKTNAERLHVLIEVTPPGQDFLRTSSGDKHGWLGDRGAVMLECWLVARNILDRCRGQDSVRAWGEQ